MDKKEKQPLSQEQPQQEEQNDQPAQELTDDQAEKIAGGAVFHDFW